jgi:D-amino-acid dehydrogenase
MEDRAIVIGGGIIGLSCALALQRHGIAVILVAPGPMEGTPSWGNAGHIAVEQVEPLASMSTVRSFPSRLFWRGGALSLPPGEIRRWLPFSLRLIKAAGRARFTAGKSALTLALALATPAWRRLVDSLDAPGLLAEDGHYILWESDKSAAAGRKAWSETDIGTARLRDATAEEMARLTALLLASPAGAIRFEGSGQITDMDMLAARLETVFLAAGGERRTGRADRLVMQAGCAASVELDDGEMLSGGAILIAAGAASGDLLRTVGHRVPIIAERGYHIQAPASAWPRDMPPVVFEDRSMIVTRFAHGLRAASFVEFSTLSSLPDPRKWDRLRAHATALALPFDAAPSQWIGARPTLPDYLPAIGKSAKAPNLFYAFGHQHLGLTLGPLTGELMGALIRGEDTAIDLGPFDIGRFD